MRKLLSLAVFAFILAISCNQNDDAPGEEFENEPNTLESYWFDSQQLYFEEIFQDNTHPNYEEAIMNPDELDKIFKIIEAVYLTDSPQRDTVFDIHQIHRQSCYNLSAINMRVDTERAEIRNLADNVIPTGDVSLDNILATYAFDTVRISNSYPQTPWLTVRTDNVLNLLPVEQALNDLESIEFAEFPKGCGGWEAHDIQLSRTDNSATIAFGIGWGDCPSGCIFRKYWEFEVSNGVAEFVRTY